MKPINLIYGSIFLLMTPIIWSYLDPSYLNEQITYWMFFTFFSLVGIAVLNVVRVWLTKFNNGRYWIWPDRHWSLGYNWPSFRNVKFFFFKKKVIFMYKISGEANQDDKEQINKIFGITSIFYRRNSARKGFSIQYWRRCFTEWDYIYDGGGAPKKKITGKFYQFDKYYYAEVEAPRMIWFGLYHFPYHGGTRKSRKKYFIDIRILKNSKKNGLVEK